MAHLISRYIEETDYAKMQRGSQQTPQYEQDIRNNRQVIQAYNELSPFNEEEYEVLYGERDVNDYGQS